MTAIPTHIYCNYLLFGFKWLKLRKHNSAFMENTALCLYTFNKQTVKTLAHLIIHIQRLWCVNTVLGNKQWLISCEQPSSVTMNIMAPCGVTPRHGKLQDVGLRRGVRSSFLWEPIGSIFRVLDCSTIEHRTHILPRNIGKENINLRCVKSRNSENLTASY
jgi:hypothetical protein